MHQNGVLQLQASRTWSVLSFDTPLKNVLDWELFLNTKLDTRSSLTHSRLTSLTDWRAWISNARSTDLFFPDLNEEVPADLLFLGEYILNDPTISKYVQCEVRRWQKYFPNLSAEEVFDKMDGPDSLGLGRLMLEEEEGRPTDHSNLYTHKGLTVNVKEISQSDFFLLSMEVEDRAAFESLAYVRSIYINTAPNVKLCYPEPFLASPSFIHGDLGFLHILQYQFWLWFMFIFLVVFYFVTFLCVVRWCSNRNQPRRETRGVSRSKCGDLITATVPVTWAISIIVSESTDATDYYDGHGTNELIVGVRAYQWGWEYYYPQGIDLNYNLKANYTSYAGKSLRYNTAANKSLTTLGIWKSYQQKELDQVVTPAHLLVLPLDNSKLLNFMRFKSIGASVQRESEAFKRTRSYSKVYSLGLVHTPSAFTEKYIKLNNFVSTTNDVNSASTYGLERQHNLTAHAAVNGVCSTFLDRASLNKFLTYTRQYNVNKYQTQVQTVSPDMWLDSDEGVSTTSSKIVMNNLLTGDLSHNRLVWRANLLNSNHLTNFESLLSYPSVMKRLGMLTEHVAPVGYGTFTAADVSSSRDYDYLSMDALYRKEVVNGNPLGGLLDPLTWLINSGINKHHVEGHSHSIKGSLTTLPYVNYNLVNTSRSYVELSRTPTNPLASMDRSPRNYSRVDTTQGDPILSRGTNSLDANLSSFSQNQVVNSPVNYLQLQATRWDDLGRWHTVASNRLRAQAGYSPVAANFAEYKPLGVDMFDVTPVASANMTYEDSTTITSDSSSPSEDSTEALQPQVKLTSESQQKLKTEVGSSKKIKRLIFARKELAFWLSPEQQEPVIAADAHLAESIRLKQETEARIAAIRKDIEFAQSELVKAEPQTRIAANARELLKRSELDLETNLEILKTREEAVFEARKPVAYYAKVDAGYHNRRQLHEVNNLYRSRLRNRRLYSPRITDHDIKSTNSLGASTIREGYPRIVEGSSVSQLSELDYKALTPSTLPSPYLDESAKAPELPDYIRWDRESTAYAHVNPDVVLDDLMRYARGEALTSAFLETDCSDYNYKDPLIMARWESRALKLLLTKNRQRALLKFHQQQVKPVEKVFTLTPERLDFRSIFTKNDFPGMSEKGFHRAVTTRELWNRVNFLKNRLALKKHSDLSSQASNKSFIEGEGLEYGLFTAYDELLTTDDLTSFTDTQLAHYFDISEGSDSQVWFYPTFERALKNAEYECWQNRQAVISAASTTINEDQEEVSALINEVKDTEEVDPDYKPIAYQVYLGERVQDYRARIQYSINASLGGSSLSALSDKRQSVIQNKLQLNRPETSLDLLATDFEEAIPTKFLSNNLTDNDVNYLTEREARLINTYLSPLRINPELHEEVTFSGSYSRGQWGGEWVTSLYNPVLSQYHGTSNLTFNPLWDVLQPQWQDKVSHYTNALGRRDNYLAQVGDYYSHTLESTNYVTPTTVTLSKDKSFIPLTGRRSRKASSIKNYNTVRELFAVNSTFTVPFTTPFTYPQSYVSVFAKSDLLSLKNSWDFETNSKRAALPVLSGGGLRDEALSRPRMRLTPNFTRQLNPVVVRTVAKNAKAGYNALRKVTKLRFEEGRAHTHTYHAANVGVERPFATNTPVLATKLLGKNKESFYSSVFYAKKPFEVFNDFANNTNSLNSYFFDFPFLVSQLSTPSRFIWFDWYTRWSRLDIQPASDASKSTLIGSQRVTKLYQLPNEEAQDLGDHESYLIRNQRYRRNHLPIWLYNVSSYTKAAVWTQNDWVDVLPQKGTSLPRKSTYTPHLLPKKKSLNKEVVTDSKKDFNYARSDYKLPLTYDAYMQRPLVPTKEDYTWRRKPNAPSQNLSYRLQGVWNYLQTADYYWTRSTFVSDSTSTQFTGSFSSSYKSTWRPYSSVQSYHYNVTTLVDLLTRRELLYRQYLERTNRIIRLPRMLTINPQNPLLAEVKASFQLIDPITYASEYSREHYYYSLRYFKFLMFKGWISSLGVGIKNWPINPKLVNEYLFFYFLAKRRSPDLGNNSTLYKSQFRPLKKGITNMIRLHGTGAVAMPIEIRLQILASSRDVIHSWAIPSAGIKIDCIPGYTSHRILIFLTPGIYWGQCMEICGRYHHWMPIIVYFMKRDLFFLWCTHFGSRKDQKLLWDTDDRQFSDYLKFVSYDRASWLTELSKRM